MKIKGDKVNIDKKWVKIDYSKINPKDYLSDSIIKILDQLKINAIKKKFDNFIIAEGGSLGDLGVGKSTLMSLCCKYIDPTYKETRNIYNLSQYWRISNYFKKMHRKDDGSARNKANLFDELKRIFFVRDVQMGDVKDAEKDFNDIRFLGCFWTGCIDDIRQAHKWIRENRVQVLLYIPNQGYVKIYKLFKGKKDNSIQERKIEKTRELLLKGIHPYTPFRGIFKKIPENNIFWIKMQIRKEKYQSLGQETKAIQKSMEMRENLERLYENTLSSKQTQKALGVSHTTLGRWRNKKKIKPIIIKIGSRRRYRYNIKEVQRVQGIIYGRDIVTQSLRKRLL